MNMTKRRHAETVVCGATPRHRSGGLHSALPPQITAAAPSTGSNAESPGYEVVSENNAAASAIQLSPTQLSGIASRRSRRATSGSANATTAPTASSHARVTIEKYAHEGEVAVCRIEAIREMAARMARTRITAPITGR